MKLNRKHIRKLILAEMYAMSGQDMRDSGRLREELTSQLYGILSGMRMDEADINMFSEALETALAQSHFDIKGEDQDYQVTIAPASQLASDFASSGMLREGRLPGVSKSAGRVRKTSWKKANPHNYVDSGYGQGAIATIPAGVGYWLKGNPGFEYADGEWWEISDASGKPGTYRVEFHDSEGVYRTLTPDSRGLIEPFGDPESYDVNDSSLHWEDAVIVNLSKSPIKVFAGAFFGGP